VFALQEKHRASTLIPEKKLLQKLKRKEQLARRRIKLQRPKLPGKVQVRVRQNNNIELDNLLAIKAAIHLVWKPIFLLWIVIRGAMSNVPETFQDRCSLQVCAHS
jgi:hypothetical protein